VADVLAGHLPPCGDHLVEARVTGAVSRLGAEDVHHHPGAAVRPACRGGQAVRVPFEPAVRDVDAGHVGT
jgi:hypothetical protein